jgi:hypothetical protein
MKRPVRTGAIALLAGSSVLACISPAIAATAGHPPHPRGQNDRGPGDRGPGDRGPGDRGPGDRGPGRDGSRPRGPVGAPNAPGPDDVNLTALYSIDGSGNNAAHPKWGASGTTLLRVSPARYTDGISTPAGASRPSARVVSNTLSAQEVSETNTRNMSDFVYVWGQFLDHDLDLSTSGTETLPVAVPAGDTSFDPASSGTKTISFRRSEAAPGTGTSSSNPREQVNEVTAFVDGSQVYGSDATRAAALRSFSGGRLKTSAGNLMSLNTAGMPNANDSHMLPDTKLFLAGDVRANENPELASLQTVFMREHNRIAAQQQLAHPEWTDEQLYQAARQIVIAELQAITYNEFLPALMGGRGLRPYTGYRADVNPSIANEFSTGAYRFGHSLLDGELSRLNNDGSEAAPSISLAESFFNTTFFDSTKANHVGDIDPWLKAASNGNAQEVNLHVVDEVRNFLFGPPGAGGLDLAALNIQRGRDHGLADFNQVRVAYGLPRLTSFAQITSNTTVQERLKAMYGTVDNIDLWVGGLAEDHLPGSSLGATFQRIIADQFTRLRDGDRLWFENIFSGRQLDRIEATRLSAVIERNTALTTLPANAFFHAGG